MERMNGHFSGDVSNRDKPPGMAVTQADKGTSFNIEPRVTKGTHRLGEHRTANRRDPADYDLTHLTDISGIQNICISRLRIKHTFT